MPSKLVLSTWLEVRTNCTIKFLPRAGIKIRLNGREFSVSSEWLSVETGIAIFNDISPDCEGREKEEIFSIIYNFLSINGVPYSRAE